jgi:hypothetical protein
MRHTLRLWTAGVLASLAGVGVMLFAPLLGLFAAIPLWLAVLSRRPHLAGAAGLLFGVGMISVLGWYDGRRRCVPPTCTFGNNDAQLAIAWVALAGGLALTALVARDARRASRSG